LASIDLHEPEEQTTQYEVAMYYDQLKQTDPKLQLEMSFDVPDLDDEELIPNSESDDIQMLYQRNLHDLERLSNCIFDVTAAIDIDTIEITSIDKVDTTSLNVTNTPSFELLANNSDNFLPAKHAEEMQKTPRTPKSNPFLESEDNEATVKQNKKFIIKSPFQPNFKGFMDIGKFIFMPDMNADVNFENMMNSKDSCELAKSFAMDPVVNNNDNECLNNLDDGVSYEEVSAFNYYNGIEESNETGGSACSQILDEFFEIKNGIDDSASPDVRDILEESFGTSGSYN
jgi:hypothetical protein